MLEQTFFQAIVALVGSLVAASCAWWYFRRVRLDRPPIGTSNGRDIAVLLVFIVVLPMLYLILPSLMLTGLLILTFTSALYIALRPLLALRYLWTFIAVLLISNIIIAQTLLGTRAGWQVYWLLTSIAVVIVVGVFGAVLPAFAPLIITAFVRGQLGIVVPAQAIFGPAAFVTYLVLARQAKERSMADWYALQATLGRKPLRAARRVRTAPAPAAALPMAAAAEPRAAD